MDTTSQKRKALPLPETVDPTTKASKQIDSATRRKVLGKVGMGKGARVQLGQQRGQHVFEMRRAGVPTPRQ